MVKQTHRNNSNHLWIVVLVCLSIAQLLFIYWIATGLAGRSFSTQLISLISLVPLVIATFIGYVMAFRLKLGHVFFPKMDKYPGLIAILFTVVLLLISFAAFFYSVF